MLRISKAAVVLAAALTLTTGSAFAGGTLRIGGQDRSAVVAAPMRDIATSTSSASSSITRRTPSWPPAMSP